jgi:hypothetical protein
VFAFITEFLFHSSVESIRVAAEIVRNVVHFFEDTESILTKHVGTADKRLKARSERNSIIH